MAEEADPRALAGEIHLLAKAFLDWLHLPRESRWDTFALQALSAALFNRYRVRRNSTDLELSQLNWPARSSTVQASIARLRALLAPSFAVYKARRSALPRNGFPTEQELLIAEQTIEALYPVIRNEVTELGDSLHRFDSVRAVAKHGMKENNLSLQMLS